MSTTFLVALIVSAMALMFWRLTLVIIGAVMIAMLLTGIDAISDGLTDHGGQSVVGDLDGSAPPQQAPPGQGPPGTPPLPR
jgi:MFS superfamily sulfate permease-like transporter